MQVVGQCTYVHGHNEQQRSAAAQTQSQAQREVRGLYVRRTCGMPWDGKAMSVPSARSCRFPYPLVLGVLDALDCSNCRALGNAADGIRQYQ